MISSNETIFINLAIKIRDNSINKISDQTKVIASSNNMFSIELVESIGEKSKLEIIEISKDLKKIYGPGSLLNQNNIDKYFSSDTLPFISRYNQKIIGFIIGAPLENFKNQSWVQYDDNLNKNNTLYTYAFIFKKEFRGKNGFAKTLKKIYTSWAKKRNFEYISGHINKKIIEKSSNNMEIIKEFKTWYDAKEPFVYYRKKI